jgi:hypothetical protein
LSSVGLEFVLKKIIISSQHNCILTDGPFYKDVYADNSKFRYNISDSAKFECSAEGHGPFNFGWKFDNDENRALSVYSNFSNKTFHYFAELNFEKLSRSDNGSYSCFLDSTIISRIEVFVPCNKGFSFFFWMKLLMWIFLIPSDSVEASVSLFEVFKRFGFLCELEIG